jgi:PHD/YefM family antitoxin component YafN of YafNO toxin-antitoxin module
MRGTVKSITIKSHKPLVVITVDEYDSMKETIELLSINPSLPAILKKERDRMDRGDYIALSDYKKKYKIR